MTQIFKKNERHQLVSLNVALYGKQYQNDYIVIHMLSLMEFEISQIPIFTQTPINTGIINLSCCSEVYTLLRQLGESSMI